jgi:hypothetical protein
MKKLFAGGLFVMGVASLPVGISPGQTRAVPVHDYSNDPRQIKLRNFFRRWECPAERYSETFIEAADDYKLDWRLLPSLSFVESSGGKDIRNNNMFGWDSGKAQFTSPTAGIHAVGYRLSLSDLYRSKSLEALLFTYNPDPDYVQVVKSVMRRIHPTLDVASALPVQNSKNRTPM